MTSNRDCIAEINRMRKKKNAIITAHCYQTVDHEMHKRAVKPIRRMLELS
ncbi:MAG: hypothetical protein LBH90_05165 [Tannerella sp.]|jgi:quinolinate synthase|nr:hypothetical protein [Tannerella sp.]